MIRFGVPPIGGKDWFGGWMYMRNLVRSLAHYGDEGIETCLFVGDDRAQDPFIRELRHLPRTRIIEHAAFQEKGLRHGTVQTLLSGRRRALLDAFSAENIDVALDWATYYGWRSEVPVVAWFPDFQHRMLPHMFGYREWWQRELGFRAQIAASKKILLSSASAEADCHRFYPSTRGKTHVARFAVPTDDWPATKIALKAMGAAEIPRDFIFLPNQLWHHKNHAVAIRAAGILAKRGSKRMIVATGRGEDPRRPGFRAELERMIDDCDARENFKLLNGVNHSQVQAMTIGANALLNPSSFEGWSTTVEEAKAVGTPLLLSDIPVHREQAPDAKFFSLGDADALADLVETMPERSDAMVASAVSAAYHDGLTRQIQFAESMSRLIRGTLGS